MRARDLPTRGATHSSGDACAGGEYIELVDHPGTSGGDSARASVLRRVFPLAPKFLANFIVR